MRDEGEGQDERWGRMSGGWGWGWGWGWGR